MDSLCCCTECARVCHRGHDCRLKRTSPTAYCDCWEKCLCKSLIVGLQPARHELFYRLLKTTNLINFPNSRGEHLLMYLAKCVERQAREQRQHWISRRRLNSGSGRTNSSNSNPTVTTSTSTSVSWDLNGGLQSGCPEEPDHDLDPPRFARDAFELLLDCPTAVYSMLTLDASIGCFSNTDSCFNTKPGFVDEKQVSFGIYNFRLVFFNFL